jgi:hypothetical protein
MKSIPKVHEEICHSVEQEIIRDDYLRSIAKRMAKDNPTIAGFVYSFTQKLPTCCRKAAMLSALTTYRLIESQIEADNMKVEIKI